VVGEGLAPRRPPAAAGGKKKATVAFLKDAIIGPKHSRAEERQQLRARSSGGRAYRRSVLDWRVRILLDYPR
jgi:hypothetical protein